MQWKSTCCRGRACRFYFDWDCFNEYDVLPGRQALSNKEKKRQGEQDRDLSLRDFYADYDWGPYRWSQPEFEVWNLLWLIGRIDVIDENRPPTNNAELKAVLKEAVSDGHLIPEITEEYQGGLYEPSSRPEAVAASNDGILA